MQVDIQSLGFPMTEALHSHVVNKLAYVLQYDDPRITRVHVRLSDTNGPRGGFDKRCLIEIRLRAAGEIVIEDTETDMYMAISRAADRAARTLSRRLSKQREWVNLPHHAASMHSADSM